MAAKTCAKYGLDTVLVERKEYPSKPNSMTCMVGPRIFEYVRMDKKQSVHQHIKHHTFLKTEQKFLSPITMDMSLVTH
jgi:hypothetical protein